MALALYRKYRPRTFAEVIGQEHVTEPLSQALRSGRLHHAYLFSGPRGCGKTSSARILARSLNCEQGPTPEPCGECDSCRSLAPDGPGSIDVIEIDAASHGGVDDARELRERAFFAPARSRFKIYVIDEAHMVSTAGLQRAAQARRGAAGLRQVHLRHDRAGEGARHDQVAHPPLPVPADPAGRAPARTWSSSPRPRASRSSRRSSRWSSGPAAAAPGTRCRCSTSSSPAPAPDGRHATPGAVALLGVTDVALIDEMCDALAAGDGAAAFATIDRVAEAGHDPRRFASDLLERLRDLIVLQQVPDAATQGPHRRARPTSSSGWPPRRSGSARRRCPAAPTSSTTD